MSSTQTSITQATIARVKLSQGGSLLLDVVRFMAALVVLLHHLVDPRFTSGWGTIGAWGHEAVCVFFVLSGFVIRFITITRVGTLSGYFIDRASRIYSVVGPALIFTLACELFALAIHPVAYNAIRDHFSWKMVPLQLFTNLTATAQCWGYALNPLTNKPFWSLSFECIYYVLYALIHYRVRFRWLWVALLLLAVGPNIALLAPVWILGCATCDLYLFLRRKKYGLALATFLFALIVTALGLARHQIIALIHASDEHAREEFLARIASHLPYLPTHANIQSLPWLSEASVSFAFVGLATAAGMLFGLLFCDRFLPNLPSSWARRVRFVADSTFALYLFHLPAFVLIASLVGHPVGSHVGQAAMLFGIIIATIPLARWLDHLKNLMRDRLNRHFTTDVSLTQ